MVEIFKALADENRLRVFNVLLNDELCVCELEVVLDLSQSNVSKHLSKLRVAGVIESQKEAQWVHYKVSSQFISQYSELIQGIKIGLMSNLEAQNDLERLSRYHKKALNCQIIKKDRDYVMNEIKKPKKGEFL